MTFVARMAFLPQWAPPASAAQASQSQPAASPPGQSTAQPPAHHTHNHHSVWTLTVPVLCLPVSHQHTMIRRSVRIAKRALRDQPPFEEPSFVQPPVVQLMGGALPPVVLSLGAVHTDFQLGAVFQKRGRRRYTRRVSAAAPAAAAQEAFNASSAFFCAASSALTAEEGVQSAEQGVQAECNMEE